MAPQMTGSAVAFAATLYSIDSSTIARLPQHVSDRLPSRGQVAVRVEIDGHPFETVLEPDGAKGHWLRVDEDLQRAAGVSAGDVIEGTVDVLPNWPEPDVPADLATALAAAPPQIHDMWREITPMARWEWVRWINATANPSTRQRRVAVSISKMSGGKRRPCCFDLAACTDPALSKNGKLRGVT